MHDDVITWLLDGDPSIRWQTQRDLQGLPGDTWEKTRALIDSEGWGRRLLDLQDPGGTWGGGLYTPKWTSTNYTLLLLRRMGLKPGNEEAIAGARHLFDDADWVEGGVSYWKTRKLPERCVNGMVLAIGSYFDLGDPRIDSIARMLLGASLADGGWNCDDYRRPVSHSSFHTTISVLEGLLQWKRRTGSSEADIALASGQEFMLAHHMFKSHNSGRVIDEVWTQPHFPPRWHYDVLRGLDHLSDAGAQPDPRAEEAIDVVLSGQRTDGRWGKGSEFTGETFFRMEPGRVPGRWNTLRALRVLQWWEKG